MRKAIRLILALILGFVAFEAAELWPVRPMWVKEKDIVCSLEILGFSSERNTLLVSEEEGDIASRTRTGYEIIEFDIETGKEKSSWHLPLKENDWYVSEISSYLSGNKLFVNYEQWDGSKTHTNFSPRRQRFKIFDAQSGRFLFGPFWYEDSERAYLSPKGRWVSTNYDVLSVDTHVVVFSFRNQPDRQHNSWDFAEDDSALAVIWHQPDMKNYSLALYALPSGKKQCEVELSEHPGEGWTFRKWEGGRIYAEEGRIHYGPVPPSTQTKVHSFELTADGLGPARREPLYDEFYNQQGQIYTQDAGNRIAQVTVGSPEVGFQWWHDTLVWIDEKVGSRLSSRNLEQPSIRFLDKQSGASLYQFTSRDLRTPLKFSPDGKRVASVHPEKGLMMWNADPFPRWPWAFGTAFLTFIFVFFFPRWRRRTKAQRPVCV